MSTITLPSHVHDHLVKTPSESVWTNRGWISADGEIMPVDWHSELGDDTFCDDNYQGAFREGWVRIYVKPNGEAGFHAGAPVTKEQFAALKAIVELTSPTSLYLQRQDKDDPNGYGCAYKVVEDRAEYAKALGFMAI